MTGGHDDFYYTQFSRFLCKSYGVWFTCSESYSQWLLATLMLERYIVLNFPFRAKQMSRNRNALAVCGAVFVMVLVEMVSAGFAFDLVATAVNSSGHLCAFNSNVSSLEAW